MRKSTASKKPSKAKPKAKARASVACDCANQQTLDEQIACLEDRVKELALDNEFSSELKEKVQKELA